MIINIVRSTPKPEFKQLFIQNMRKLADIVRQEEGSIRYELFVDPNADSRLMLYEEWVSREALAVHLSQPHMIEHHHQAKPWFEGEIEMVTFEIANADRTVF
jgi:quinol monooxygenase YgiN